MKNVKNFLVTFVRKTRFRNLNLTDVSEKEGMIKKVAKKIVPVVVRVLF